MPRSTNPDFLAGVPQLLILQLLDRGEPLHGYQLVERIRLETGERLNFGEGSIYPVLHKLEREGWIEGRKELAGGRQRIVYRILPAGQRRLADSAAEWRNVASAIQQVLQGGGERDQLAWT